MSSFLSNVSGRLLLLALKQNKNVFSCYIHAALVCNVPLTCHCAEVPAILLHYTELKEES